MISLKWKQSCFTFFPDTNSGIAVLGLIDNYNAPGTVLENTIKTKELNVTLSDHGLLGIISPNVPKGVEVDNIKSEFEYKNGILLVTIPTEEHRRNHNIDIQW